MAYLRSLDNKCKCGKLATVEVIDRWNSSRGNFCRTCGQRKLRELRAYEESDAKSASAGAAIR